MSAPQEDNELDEVTEALTGLVDVGDPFDHFPTTVAGLADLTITEAAELEARSDSLSGLVLVADGLLDSLVTTGVGEEWQARADRFARTVRAASERTVDAAATASRAIDRVIDRYDALVSNADADDVYDELLTARLHVPIAASLVDDAERDARTAVRHLARVALASACTSTSNQVDADTDIARRARSTLRLELPGLAVPSLADEEPELWSTTLDELRIEVGGLLANLLVDRRTFLILEHTGRPNRFVQALTFDRGLVAETVADRFLDPDDQLTHDDRTQLESLGWSPPSDDTSQPNWLRRWNDDVDVRIVADLLVDTLTDIHDVLVPDDLALIVHPGANPFDV